MATTSTAITGSDVRFFHTFNDMTNFSFTLPNGTIVKTCPAALGYSFAAGTSDGPGAFDFTQNDTGKPNANPVWAIVSGILKAPSSEQKACHYPKPILLDVGEINTPYLWTPNVVDIQMFRVGQFFFIISPGEATTMSGRRWRSAVASAAQAASIASDPIVVLGGPANSYTHYIVTEEEYGVQRYEGASTLYGPNTLNAYINLTTKYMPYLASSPPSTPLSPGPTPPNNVDKSLSFITGVVYDNPPIGKSFGDVTVAPSSSYKAGSIVAVSFVGANPRNNLRLEGTFAAIESLGSNGNTWTQILSDRDWDLIYNWNRDGSLIGTSTVTIQWDTTDVSSGTYRVRYYGDSKAPITGHISAFEGTSAAFTVQ
jgi:neutral ceramidase